MKSEAHILLLGVPLLLQGAIIVSLVNLNSGLQLSCLRFKTHVVLVELFHFFHVAFGLLLELANQTFDLLLIFVDLLFQTLLLLTDFLDLGAVAQN